jgi:integrase
VSPFSTPHYFRHYFATLCYYSGVDILTAAAWLGHTSPDVIMNIYAHLDNTRGVRDASKISGIFKKVAK